MSTVMAAPTSQTPSTERTSKLTLLPAAALAVGSKIGGGVFNLPSGMSRHTAPGGIIIGRLITRVGTLMLAFLYQGLVAINKLPDSKPWTIGFFLRARAAGSSP